MRLRSRWKGREAHGACAGSRAFWVGGDRGFPAVVSGAARISNGPKETTHAGCRTEIKKATRRTLNAVAPVFRAFASALLFCPTQ